MILLKTLTIKNFLSHESTVLDFTDNDKRLIDGRSGSGKSTITEAILWCLYGRGRSDNRSLVRRGSKSATIALKLVDGPTETLITRTVSSAGKNGLAITQNKGSKGQFLPIERVGLKDLQDWIESTFLKASYELFTNSVAYPQENENSFVKSTASKRKDLLLEIVRAGNFDQLYDKAKDVLSANELENALAMSKKSNLEDVITTSKEVAASFDKHRVEYDLFSKKVETCSLQEKELEKKINDISQLSNQIKDKKTTHQLLTKSIEVINRQIDNDKTLILEHEKVDIETARNGVEEIAKLEAEVKDIEMSLKDQMAVQQKINAHLANKPVVFDYTKDIEGINNRLIPLIKDTSKCPAGDKCPFVIPIKGQIQFLTQQIEEKSVKSIAEKKALELWEKEYISLSTVTIESDGLYSKLEEIRGRIGRLAQSKEIVEKYDSFGKTLEEIRVRGLQLQEEKNKNTVELARAETDIYELEQTLSKVDVNKANIELSEIRTSLSFNRKMMNEESVAMALATNAQKTIEDASGALVELQTSVKRGMEDKECLELIKEAFSQRGVKAVVIDYLVPQLEERINAVLGQMSDFRIRLDTQKATVDEEGVKEGLFITVLNDLNEELPFTSYSGGEKIKIIVAISEALASLMNQIGFRIMDENIVSLDKESTEGFVVVLTRLQDKFPQLLIISHLQEVKDIFEKQVMIIKTNGVSKII